MSFWLSFPMKTFSGTWQSGDFQNNSSVLVLEDNGFVVVLFSRSFSLYGRVLLPYLKVRRSSPILWISTATVPHRNCLFQTGLKISKISRNMLWRVYIESLRISFDGARRIVQLLVFGMTLKISSSNSNPHTVGKDATHNSVLSTIFSCFPL